MTIYSHPVLRNDTDDIKGEATFSTPKIGKNKLIIDDISIKNHEILNLINNGKASYLVYIENKNAFFSRTIQSQAPIIKINFKPEVYPEGNYFMELMVVANKDIIGYELDSFHADYHGHDFIIKTGDILAYLGSRTFEIDKNFGSLNEPKSIFVFEHVSDDDIKGRSQVYFAEHKIKIQVHEDDVDDILNTMKGIDINYLVLAYIVPALIYALHELKSDIVQAEQNGTISEYDGENWAESIGEALTRNNLNLFSDNSVLIAHKLAQDPIIASSEHLLDLATRRGMSDED